MTDAIDNGNYVEQSNQAKMLFPYIDEWAPFRIDALGLVTMLGATEVDRAVGRLTQNRYTDWLPLLGAFTISSNQFTEHISGFTLYNISDGIVALDLTGWFARWLLTQDLTYNSTTITISGQQQKRPVGTRAIAFTLGFLTLSVVTIFAALIGDWWGLSNAISMLVSVLVRQVLLGLNRKAIDRAVQKADQRSPEVVKVFLTIPNGKAVTIIAPRGVVIDCLLTTPQSLHPSVYKSVMAIGWIAFGIHVISLGMSTLFSQLLSVCLLLVSTVLVIYQIGDDHDHVGSWMQLQRLDAKGKDFRAAAYSRLDLTEEEENKMLHWSLFPPKCNTHWWEKYRECLADDAAIKFATWDSVLMGADQVSKVTPVQEYESTCVDSHEAPSNSGNEARHEQA